MGGKQLVRFKRFNSLLLSTQSGARQRWCNNDGGLIMFECNSFKQERCINSLNSQHHYPSRYDEDVKKDEVGAYETRFLPKASKKFVPNNMHLSTTRRNYHASRINEKGASIVMGLGALALTAKAGQYTVKAYDEWKNSQPEEGPTESIGSSAKPKEEDQKSKDDNKNKTTDSHEQKENIFSSWFGAGVGTNYYKGGFEEKMTRREAALILGVRESASVKRIKEAYRKLLILNHPDTGGSNYIAGKTNEAKDMLLKGKR